MPLLIILIITFLSLTSLNLFAQDTANITKKKMFVGLGAGFASLILAGGYFVFMFLPNTPENIYRRGMASIGVGLEELAVQSIDTNSQATEFSGTFNSISPDGTDTVIRAPSAASQGATGKSI